jgi:hypothetical protein
MSRRIFILSREGDLPRFLGLDTGFSVLSPAASSKFLILVGGTGIEPVAPAV